MLQSYYDKNGIDYCIEYRHKTCKLLHLQSTTIHEPAFYKIEPVFFNLILSTNESICVNIHSEQINPLSLTKQCQAFPSFQDSATNQIPLQPLEMPEKPNYRLPRKSKFFLHQKKNHLQPSPSTISTCVSSAAYPQVSPPFSTQYSVKN